MWYAIFLVSLVHIFAQDFRATKVQRPLAKDKFQPTGEDTFYPEDIIKEYAKRGRNIEYLRPIESQFSSVRYKERTFSLGQVHCIISEFREDLPNKQVIGHYGMMMVRL